MTYAEAVKRAEVWHRCYDLEKPNGQLGDSDAHALAVLRRAEKVMEAVENWDGRVEWQSAKPLVLAADTYRAALRYRNEKEKPSVEQYPGGRGPKYLPDGRPAIPTKPDPRLSEKEK